MAVNITDADTYIESNVIVIDDWTDSDEAKKQRILNVALTTLNRVYLQYTIPDAAVYEFAAVLAVAFNDTNAQMQNGVKQFSVAGISYTFEGGRATLESLIPVVALDLIGKANGVTLGQSTKRIKWTVL
ncbi:hypothetical protein [Neobacillus sp. 19]|uniref:hypothetical protein n=1 Tax=Neobacillus sp. 19 TaxID=3394458 RepID=UPI003BF63C75